MESKVFNVELSEDEIYSLDECLKELCELIDERSPILKVARELRFKFSRFIFPNSKKTLGC